MWIFKCLHQLYALLFWKIRYVVVFTFETRKTHVKQEQTDVTVEAPIEEEKPAPLFNTYMGELGKY